MYLCHISLSLSLSLSPFFFSKQLCVCLETIVRHDNWNDIVQKIHSFLSSDNQQTWPGALLSLYQLSKKYK